MEGLFGLESHWKVVFSIEIFVKKLKLGYGVLAQLRGSDHQGYHVYKYWNDQGQKLNQKTLCIDEEIFDFHGKYFSIFFTCF